MPRYPLTCSASAVRSFNSTSNCSACQTKARKGRLRPAAQALAKPLGALEFTKPGLS